MTSAVDLEASVEGPPDWAVYPRTLGRLAQGRNINETTLLATDYLNHFNEIIMLLDLVPDMPECLEDAREWAPKSYEDHFRDSVFRDKELAILAYHNAPAKYRRPFDLTVGRMNRVVLRGLQKIDAVGDDSVARNAIVAEVTGLIRRQIDLASAIIHGNDSILQQGDIDELMGG